MRALVEADLDLVCTSRARAPLGYAHGMSEVSGRAREILDAIERDAQARRRAMSAGASGPLTGARRPIAPSPAEAPDPLRLLQLVDHVVAQAERAQQRLEELDSAVSALAARLDVAFASTTTPADPAVPYLPADPSAPAGVAGAPLTEPAAGGPSPISDGARLVAIEMAVAGFTRNEVRERLAREYAITEMSAMLDEVFGEGSAGDSRMPWGAAWFRHRDERHAEEDEHGHRARRRRDTA